MGSSGSGMFGTYRAGGIGSIAGGSSSEEVECPLVIENINLDDVAISEYFLNYKNVPDVNKTVELSTLIVNKRLVVILTDTGEVIGNLPVKYNYLNICMKKDKKYSGTVKSSGLVPIPYIVVNLYA